MTREWIERRRKASRISLSRFAGWLSHADATALLDIAEAALAAEDGIACTCRPVGSEQCDACRLREALGRIG